jgi:broad specificity phosphatase PhoE
MQIVLARHGQPNFERGARVSPRDLRGWIDRYNEAGVFGEPPSDVLRCAGSMATIVSSSARRCVESALRLAPDRTLVDDLFREADLPYPSWSYPKLNPGTWAVLFRAAWALGFSANAESFSAAKVRARLAATRLIELGRDTSSVLLIGHGIMNMLIAQQLLKLGASGPKRPAGRCWGCSVYRLA